MTRAVRVKRTHKFQLDIQKDLESWLHEVIPILTQQRKFSQYVRDGLRLMIDLSAGNVDVLLELFPWVGDKFAVGQGSPPTPPNISELERKVDSLTELLAIMQKSNQHYEMTGSKPLDAPLAVVTAAKAMSSEDIADNFLSMFND